MNLDAIYGNLVRQIAGEYLPEAGLASLDEDVKLATAKAAWQMRIASLAKRVKTEKQFNHRVEYNPQLRQLKAELAACFDANISEDAIREIAKRKPLRAVFRDASFVVAAFEGKWWGIIPAVVFMVTAICMTKGI